MMIFGKPLSAYVTFAKPFLILVLVTGIARLGMSLLGVPNATAKWLSITAIVAIGVVYYAIKVHRSGFGSYKQLLAITVMLNLVGQLVIVLGILLAIATGVDNIFSAPEYAFGGDGKTWVHLAAHLFGATTVGSLGPWLIGSLVMAITKKVSRAERIPETARV